jgi:hypothetical protein
MKGANKKCDVHREKLFRRNQVLENGIESLAQFLN